jgi:hypothetical protein
MYATIAQLLRADPQAVPQPTVAAWWPRWRDGAAHAPTPAAQALLGGFDADRVGWAFAAGYQAALRRLRPELPPDTLAALCVTEPTGNRPGDIATRIEPAPGGGWRLDGAKRWTTLGPESSLLLVVGRLPAAAGDDRPRLKVAQVPVPSPGLQLQPMPDTRFVPEVPHARVQLDNVVLPAGALLPGDGYDRVVKPFRTIEDLHVTLAVLAYLLREARGRGWPQGFAERLLALIAALAALADAPADDPAVHLAAEGTLQFAQTLYAEAGGLWAAAPDDPAAVRWRRDQALFAVAGPARAQRAVRAWQRLQRP